GSSNSSLSGYQENYEKVRLAKSWIPAFEEIVQEEEKEFDDLWNGRNPFVEIHDYTKAAQKDILHEIEERENRKNEDEPIKLRDYQNDAIEAWKQNNYRGFYVMATGTGKTWTAIFSAKELVKNHPAMIVICAPYKHLIKQWAEDVEKCFGESNIILVSSENPSWPSEITNEITKSKFKNNQVIVISTIVSFNSPRFTEIVNKFDGEKLLIVDEAHRFTNRTEEIQNQYKYMLGLSATPFSGTSAARGRELMNFFGGQVFNLPIEDALGKYLVNYYYHPIYVYASAYEEEKFNNMTRTILGCFKNGVCIDKDKLVKTLRNRLRVISMAEDKQTNLNAILKNVKEKDHIVVYCGDGKLFDASSGEELRHISTVKRELDKLGYKPSQFTASENMKERMSLVNSFNKGTITALAAIRCLDEGINIPSIKSALILSSNDDYREFVQRRGRILRKYPGKEFADIYDVIVLPSSNCTSWAQIELRRFREYSKLALNNNELENELIDKLAGYGLSLEDVDVYDYEDMEDVEDE
ncbi:MAG: DEAD/DEAH box helicase family protein, partial [Erysipelotrichaceae bacterium]|nr:DEAD/DEAH box helicase family protein [Erysipelotrichaceae bacterium]